MMLRRDLIGSLALMSLLAAACSGGDDVADAQQDSTPSSTTESAPTEEAEEVDAGLDPDHDGMFILYDSEARTPRVAANLAAPDDATALVAPDGQPIGNLREPEAIPVGRLLVPSRDPGSFLYVSRSLRGEGGGGMAGGGRFVIEIDMEDPSSYDEVATIPFGIQLLLADPDRPGDLFGTGREGCFRVGVSDPEPVILLPGEDCTFLSTGHAVWSNGDLNAPVVQVATLDGEVTEFEPPEFFDVLDVGINATGDVLFVIGKERNVDRKILYYRLGSGEQVTASPETVDGDWTVLSGSADGALLVTELQSRSTVIHRLGVEPVRLSTPPGAIARDGWLAPDGSVALVLSKDSLDARTFRVRLDSYRPDGQHVATLFQQDWSGTSSNAVGADLWVVGDASNTTVAVQFDGDSDLQDLFIGGTDAPLEPIGLDGQGVIEVVGDDATGDLVLLTNGRREERFTAVFAAGGGQTPVVDERDGEYPFGPPFVLDLHDGEALIALAAEDIAATYRITAEGSSEVGEVDGYQKASNRSPEDTFFLDIDGDVLLTSNGGTYVCERDGCGTFDGPVGKLVQWSVPPERTARYLFIDG